MLSDAFNSVLKLTQRDMQFQRDGSAAVNVKISPSNYSRNLQVSSDMVVLGREFIMSKTEFDKCGVDELRRGDRLIDSSLGDMAIVEILEMYDIGGVIVGYRLRTG